MIRYLMGVLCAAFAVGPLAAAEIAYVADGVTGEYCGTGFGISVSVSAPASGATVEYAESETGPWSATPVEYADVCTAKLVWFRITATGYGTVVDSRPVTVTPKDIGGFVWPILPTEGYAYDGTAKEPEPGFGDGEPSILARDDFDVAYEDNVEAGVAKMVITGKRNYAGRDEQEFDIAPAENAWTTAPAVADWTYGQAASEPVSAAKSGTATVTWSSGAKPTLPGSYTATFTVPASRNYRELTATVPFTVHAATVAYVADGATGEYCGTGFGISVSVSAPASGATVEYAESETGPWSATPVEYADVCTAKPVWFRITAAGYGTVVDSRPVTVTPKDIGGFVWPILPAEGYTYDGTAKEPEPGFGDGEPSILTRDDFDIAYEDNVEAGTAKMVITGKRNYAGRDEQEFDIDPAENAWTTAPAVADWTYGQAASEPISAAKSGTATVTWSSGAKPTLPGSYTATFTVPASRNYRELTATVPFTVHAATVAYVADGVTGEYCGTGFGISVSVSAPASGATVEYAESETGPWSATPVEYADVCTAKPVWFRITATGYGTVVDSRPVTVTPKDIGGFVWPILPAAGYAYDGTAKEPEPGFGDGEPSILTRDDFDVSYEDNVEAGTAKMVITGKRNYAGRDEQEFDIAPAKAWNDEPGAGTVPVGGLSKFDATFVYDGQPHTIDTDALAAIEKADCTPTVSYSLTKEGVYQAEPFFFTDVVTTSFWYKISLNNANYEDYVHVARLTITPRDIALVTVASIADQDYTGAAVEPVPVVTDGEPSIISAIDYTVAYADNVNPGAATLTLTGRGNYMGTKSVGFTILSAAREVVFDALGGRIGQSGAVTQSLARAYGDLPTATRSGYVLDGWFLGVTNGAPKAVRGAALLADAGHTLFARWSVDPSVSPNPETLYRWEATGEGTVRILGFRDSSVSLTRMVLPDTLGGLPVAAVARGAFANSACGAADLTLPVFCTELGFRAFSGIGTLVRVTFTPVRDWMNPGEPGSLSIGDYAFAATGLESVRLPASVAAVGNYAFADCRKLAEVTVLGQPAVGKRPFRRAGIGLGAAPVVRLDPALAGNLDYRNAILQDVADAVVRTDAIVEGLSLTGLGVSDESVTVSVSVARAADWGEVDATALRVEYRANLGDAPVDLVPRHVERRVDGSLAVEVAAPGGSSGFFRVKSVQ